MVSLRLKQVALFFVCIPITVIVDLVVQFTSGLFLVNYMKIPSALYETSPELIPFNLITYLITSVVMCNDLFFNYDKYNWKHWIWYGLTISHAIAHITHPAHWGQEVNMNYTPFWDYIIHMGQCYVAYYMSSNWGPIGYFMGTGMAVAGAMAHMDKMFMAQWQWLVFSGFGVLGAVFHMMLLHKYEDNEVASYESKEKTKRDTDVETDKWSTFMMNFVIWGLPFLGYMNFPFIPFWDSFTNFVGLFRFWHLNYWYFRYTLYEKPFTVPSPPPSHK